LQQAGKTDREDVDKEEEEEEEEEVEMEEFRTPCGGRPDEEEEDRVVEALAEESEDLDSR
jgi:hypothetical protein